MPRTLLSVEDSDESDEPPLTLLTPGGTVCLPQRRLIASVYLGKLGNQGRLQRAVIDTGAPTRVLPRHVWTPLAARRDIEWVTDFPARSARTNLPVPHIVANGRYHFQLGRVWLAFRDGDLASREVLAICTSEPPRNPDEEPLPLLIGLADVMHGRTLLIEASDDGQRWSATLSEP